MVVPLVVQEEAEPSIPRRSAYPPPHRYVGSTAFRSTYAPLRYLEAHRNGAKYLVAVVSSNEADAIILETNQPVMALGGFSGSDPILTTTQLAALVKNGTVRFFLLNSSGGGGPGGGPGGGQSALITWITQHTTAVPASQWQSTLTSSGSGGTAQLYEYTSAS